MYYCTSYISSPAHCARGLNWRSGTNLKVRSPYYRVIQSQILFLKNWICATTLLKCIFYKKGARISWLKDFLQIFSHPVQQFSGTKSAKNPRNFISFLLSFVDQLRQISKLNFNKNKINEGHFIPYSWVSKVFTHCLCKEQNYPNNRLCEREMGGSSLL